MHADESPRDAPTGLPSEEEPEPSPLGAPDPEAAPDSGEDAMPGIVKDGDQPDAG